MKGIKKTLAISLASTVFFTPALFAKSDLEKKLDYEIHCSIFHVGDCSYTTKENDKEYEVYMKAEPSGFFKYLGLKYYFSTEGYKEDGKLYPKHFKRINKGKKPTKKDKHNTNSYETSEEIEVTDVWFDYEKLEATAYAYRESDGEREVKYDIRNNPVKITKEVKEFLTCIEEIKRHDLKDYYELKTVAKGGVHSFPIRKVSEERVRIKGEYYSAVVYETEVHKELFGVNSEAKIWIHKEKDHTVLKCWIKNGPLWTSIILEYSGTKADLR